MERLLEEAAPLEHLAPPPLTDVACLSEVFRGWRGWFGCLDLNVNEGNLHTLLLLSRTLAAD